MKLSLLAWSAVIAVGAAIAADAPDTAGGTFKSKAVTLEIRSAIAFKAKSSLGSDDALIVAVTNATMHADALADYDRRRAVEKRIKDDDTGVVYFEFRPDGSDRGLSYYFAPGNGCGFCTSEVVSTVKLSGGKLAEYLADEHPDKSVRITRGYARGNTAVLLVSGESIAGKLVGEALLMKEKDAWRVDDELVELDSR